jgi:hypothetical protein
LDIVGVFLGVVLNFFIILVASDGGTNVDGKLGDDNIINGISERGKVVKNCDFVGHERG